MASMEQLRESRVGWTIEPLGAALINTSSQLAPRADQQSITVLVVEDEVLVRFDTADMLREAGYLVLEAANADEARSLLKTFPEIALIFSDIQMPGSMDGAAFARFVRENYPEIQVILTSGAVAPPDEADAAIPFFAKPYRPNDVVKRIDELLH
jgi:CheY-like chemotaxis protein